MVTPGRVWWSNPENKRHRDLNSELSERRQDDSGRLRYVLLRDIEFGPAYGSHVILAMVGSTPPAVYRNDGPMTSIIVVGDREESCLRESCYSERALEGQYPSAVDEVAEMLRVLICSQRPLLPHSLLRRLGKGGGSVLPNAACVWGTQESGMRSCRRSANAWGNLPAYGLTARSHLRQSYGRHFSRMIPQPC